MNDAEQPQFSKRRDKFHRSSTDRVYCSQTLRRYKLELALGALADLDIDNTRDSLYTHLLQEEIIRAAELRNK